MMPIRLLMPMSGTGLRFQKAGYHDPKPLIPVSGTPMVERLLKVFPMDWPAHFVLNESHRDTKLPTLLKNLRPQSTVTFIPIHSLGPGEAIRRGLSDIPDEAPIFVSYCDYGMIWDPAEFQRFVTESRCDACVISYRGFHPHYVGTDKYAYSRLEGERVVEVREKGSFTDQRENEFASSGGYYFRTSRQLKEALEYQFANNLTINGETYTSLTVESLLRRHPGSDVRVFEIPAFFQWGTPRDLRAFEFWERSYQASLRTAHRRPTVEQILMPMAGQGSRFHNFGDLPKALIPIDGKPMFQAALDSLPKAERTVLVTLSSIAKQLGSAGAFEVVPLSETPAGQALSTEEGLSRLAPNAPVLVSSCDHGIVLSAERWKEFRSIPCDAAIFCIRGFPGTTATPEKFAYVIPDATNEPFPKIRSVSVKRPVSSDPSNDWLLVGTFWFRNPAIAQEGISLLKERQIRVNGELYLDSIFSLLLEKGYGIRLVELEGYLGWGDPDSFKTAHYWRNVFCGHAAGRYLTC